MAIFGKDYAGLGDERLMELVVRGDQRAFGAIYDRYHRRVLNYFHRMLWQDRDRLPKTWARMTLPRRTSWGSP